MKLSVRLFAVSIGRMVLAVALVAALLALPAGAAPAAKGARQKDIIGPAGSGQFGASVTVLPNGNIVVADPYYDAGATADVGAVYLYDGATGTLISTLTGSTVGDRVGYVSDTWPGVTVLSNGNYVVCSRLWDNGTAADAGAATWGSASTGVSGVVSAANSLVGSTANDWVGIHPSVTALSNGNYVVGSPYWANGGVADAGAATWGNGTTGIAGPISAANSLVGDWNSDMVGSVVTALSNGNYVVSNPLWHGYAGAVTWGNGTTGIVGLVSAANSLVGTSAGIEVPDGQVTELSNGNYVVSSPWWDSSTTQDVGAATWANGATGVVGAISAANSLVGSTTLDNVGVNVLALSNGNYVLRVSAWDNGGIVNAGAVTWGNGTTGTSGVISAANSLVGSTAEDWVGESGVTALSNGNYVVRSYKWDNSGATDAGAVTWGNGTTGIAGAVSAANSLVGSTTDDYVGLTSLTLLSNGNYVVTSEWWDNGPVANAGAVTWANGATGIAGPVSVANSLVGGTAGDNVGYDGVTALSNGNYVVSSSYWDNGPTGNVGAVTWGNGTTGIAGVVSTANSLVGSTLSDEVGSVTALSNGNYVVSSPNWDDGGTADAGAVTWGNGAAGTVGVVSTANSLVGSAASDRIGQQVTALSNGNYVVSSYYWDNGGVADTGAATWRNGTVSSSGAVSAANSLVGSTAGDQIGYCCVTALSNGNYVVTSPYWDNGGVTNAGAATWGNGSTGTSGAVSAANSLVGSTANDQISYWNNTTPLSNGDYVVVNELWDNGATVDAGAMTWGNGIGGTVGPITYDNSVRGTAASGGSSMIWIYDTVNDQLVVGRPADNIVTLFRFRPFFSVSLPLVLKNK